MTIAEFVRHRPFVYHVATVSDLRQIKSHGLLSSRSILKLLNKPESSQTALLRSRRNTFVPLSCPEGEFILRDQKWMTDETLRSCLDPSLGIEDWYEELNSRVFFWVNPRKALELSQAPAVRGLPQLILQIRARSLLDHHYERAQVTTFNAGYTMRRPVPRCLKSFIPLSYYTGSISMIVELTFKDSVIDIADHIEN